HCALAQGRRHGDYEPEARSGRALAGRRQYRRRRRFCPLAGAWRQGEDAVNGPRFNEMLALISRGLMVRTDSRQVQPGEVFALMPSAADKAAAYLADALSRGAGWVVAGHGVSMPGDMKAGLVRV